MPPINKGDGLHFFCWLGGGVNLSSFGKRGGLLGVGVRIVPVGVWFFGRITLPGVGVRSRSVRGAPVAGWDLRALMTF